MTKTITFDKQMRDGEQRAAFQSALEEMGMTLTSSSSFERAFARTRDAADENGRVPGERLRAIVEDAESSMEMLQGVSDSFR
jgi:isopropylmalate/homocitrate/citramalate synthase